MENKSKKINIKGLSKKQIIIIICVILGIIVLAFAGNWVINDTNPIQSVQDVFQTNEQRIIGKWQGEGALNAYEFYEDGSYDSYISTFSFKGSYEVKGSKLVLKNPSSSSNVVYHLNINGDNMTLTLDSQDGQEADNKEIHKFKRVDHFNLKTLTDALQDFAKDVKEEESTTKSK